MQITAAVLRAADGPYALEQVDLAEPLADEVLVRIVAAGMCHTDVLPRGEVTFSPPPIITGHEGAGVVEAVGADVTGIAVGDHVVLSFDSCGTCEACAAGNPAHCETFLMRNLLGRRLDFTTGVTDAAGAEVASRWFGQSSFATHAMATARNVVVVDKELPLEKLGPLGCGIQTGAGSVLVALDVQPGKTIVVFGAGAVGLAAIMAAKVADAATIIAVDLHQHRLDLALELGATHAIDGSGDDVVAQIHALTGGGAHYAIDTTGVPAVMTNALAGLRLGGVAGFVGIQVGDLVLDGAALIGKTAIGILEGNTDPHTFIPRMLELWQAGQFPFDRLIEEFPLAEINEAEQASLSGRVIKPVLRP
ncbi:MAG: aryl-alcohol dehydrogenase [Actinomycetota bacterium]|nr:aryl-alcohol dehydrogenase [Actinomycetota bacterium]